MVFYLHVCFMLNAHLPQMLCKVEKYCIVINSGIYVQKHASSILASVKTILIVQNPGMFVKILSAHYI